VVETRILISPTWIYTHLYWFRDIMPYVSDISVYIWRPHLEPMAPLGATICICPRITLSGDLLIYFQPSKSASSSAAEVYQTMHSFIPDEVKTFTISTKTFFWTTLAIYRRLISDTAKFVACISFQVQNLVWILMPKSPLPSYSGGRPNLSPYSRWKKGKRNESVDKMIKPFTSANARNRGHSCLRTHD
jgi:hypothetical protein